VCKIKGRGIREKRKSKQRVCDGLKHFLLTGERDRIRKLNKVEAFPFAESHTLV
jgi:hypothetical protein